MRSEHHGGRPPATERLEATRRQFLFARQQVNAHVLHSERRAAHHDEVLGIRTPARRPDPA
jgi:hypothetical protein